MPYGTQIWLVRDADEENGSHKIHTFETKKKIIAQHVYLGIPPDIVKSDIIPIVNYA